MSERCDRNKTYQTNGKSGNKSSETRKTLIRYRKDGGYLNDSIKLHSLRGRHWRLGTMDMRLHDAERLAKPELQVLKLNNNGDMILPTPNTEISNLPPPEIENQQKQKGDIP